MILRRETGEFSLSFLDLICCGFGAIILLLMITKTVEPTVLEKSQINLESQITQRELALHEIKGQLKELRRQLTMADGQLTGNLTELVALERELTLILSRFATTSKLAEENFRASQTLAAAKQSLTDEMVGLLGKDFRRSTSLVGGIVVDSDYIIFVIDTSGSMQNFAWSTVVRKIVEILEIYPRVKGIQILNDMGEYMFSKFHGQWIPDSPEWRKAITTRLQTWTPSSNSSPVEGIEKAITTFWSPDKQISIYVFGDDFRGSSIEAVVDRVDRINRVDDNGNRRMRIHGLGFPALVQARHPNAYRFAALMRELTFRNDGTFVALPYSQ